MNIAALSTSGLTDQASRVLSNAFMAVAGMLGVTALSAYASRGVHVGLAGSIGLLVATIAVLFMVRATRNSGWGLFSLAVLSILIGIGLGPMLTHYLALPSGQTMVVGAAGLTALITATCSAYVRASNRDFSGLRMILLAALVALIIGSLVMLFFPIPAVMLLLSVVGVVVFTGFLLMEFSDILQGRETNYISAACGLYLSIINLFTSILRVLGFLGSQD